MLKVNVRSFHQLVLCKKYKVVFLLPEITCLKASYFMILTAAICQGELIIFKKEVKMANE